jgi:hypothetical protein
VPERSWGVFLVRLGRYRGSRAAQVRPTQAPRDLKAQQRRDSTDKETTYASHGKDEVKGSSPFVGSRFRTAMSPQFDTIFVHGCPLLSIGRGGESPVQDLRTRASLGHSLTMDALYQLSYVGAGVRS